MKKRILASVLVLVMLICLLPVTAIAGENEGLDGQRCCEDGHDLYRQRSARVGGFHYEWNSD